MNRESIYESRANRNELNYFSFADYSSVAVAWVAWSSNSLGSSEDKAGANFRYSGGKWPYNKNQEAS